MAYKKMEEENVLLLGEKQEEIIIKEEKQVQKKKLLLPIMMMIVGALMMLTGAFYNQIIEFFGLKDEGKVVKSEEEIKKENKELLECSKTNTDDALEVITITSYSLNFKDLKLFSGSQKIVLKTVENSDIGPENIKNLGNKYLEGLSVFKDYPGIEISNTSATGNFVLTINYDYSKIDSATFPQNNYISLTNKLNDTYKDTKKVMVTELGYSCD